METMLRTIRLTAGLILLGLPPLLAQPADLDAKINRLVPEITEIRHHLHQNPELGNREHQTAALVADFLRRLGFDQVTTGVAHTGVVGLLHGGRPGPVIALRADMDALPVTEDTPYPWKSTVRSVYLGQEVGVSHACGHDIHTAVQLGVAAVLAGMRDQLPGTVKLIFQPAEEGPPPGEAGGAQLMVQEGVMENPRPEAVFGLHTFSEMEVGKVGYTPGPSFAAVANFEIEIQGTQAHAAQPHQGIDPIVMAAQVVMALQTIRSRTLNPLEPSVVTVGILRGGTRQNIIPATVQLAGTIRTYSAETQSIVERRMREIVSGITAAGGGSAKIEFSTMTNALVNHLELTRRVAPSLAKAVGEANVSVIPPTMGGEDFAEFANLVPGFYFRLGTVQPGIPSGGHHTPTFAADDRAIPVGMRAMLTLVLDYLQGNQPAVTRAETQPKGTP